MCDPTLDVSHQNRHSLVVPHAVSNAAKMLVKETFLVLRSFKRKNVECINEKNFIGLKAAGLEQLQRICFDNANVMSGKNIGV